MNALDWARHDAGLSVSEACAWLGRSRRTWRRWQTEGAPAWAVRSLRLRAGYLDELGWQGWRLTRGTLFAPDLRDGWERGAIYAAWWDRQRIGALERQILFGKESRDVQSAVDRPTPRQRYRPWPYGVGVWTSRGAEAVRS